MKANNNPTFFGGSGKLGCYVAAQVNGETILRTRFLRPRKATARRLINNSDFAQRAAFWREMSPREQDGWSRLAPLVPNWEQGQNAPPLSGYLCFQQAGAARMAQKLALTAQAPAFVSLPPSMGETGVRAQKTAQGVQISVQSSGYDCAVQVWCCRPLMPSQGPSAQEKFALLATLSGLDAGETDISRFFQARFRFGVRDGHKLVVRFVPLSPEGFRGLTVETTCEVTASFPPAATASFPPAARDGQGGLAAPPMQEPASHVPNKPAKEIFT